MQSYLRGVVTGLLVSVSLASFSAPSVDPSVTALVGRMAAMVRAAENKIRELAVENDALEKANELLRVKLGCA